jgi:hypothetical protein
MLGMFDLGSLVGPPAVGTLWSIANYLQLPAYPTVFALVAGFIAMTAVYYSKEPRGVATSVTSCESVEPIRESADITA